MTTAPKHRLRWYQYSLRSLFVLTVLVAIAGSWFAVKKQQVERERAAVKRVKEMGGFSFYQPQLEVDGWPMRNAAPPGPAWLRARLGDDFFTRITNVNLDRSNVTDAGLEHLKGLTQLKHLSLVHTRVTDTGLEHLKGLTKLGTLNLFATDVTDEGVKKLQEALPNCKIVR